MAMTAEEARQNIAGAAEAHFDPWKAPARDMLSARRTSEQLDPETMARMDRAVESARSLRGRPLVSGMAARTMGEQASKQQSAAMAGAQPERQFAAMQQGAGIGRRILTQQGQQMAGEAGARFNVGLRAAQVRQQLESGQVMFALEERLKRFAASKGIQMNESQARMQAAQVAIGLLGQMGGKPDTPGTTTPTTGHAGDSAPGASSLGPIQHTPPAM